MKPEACSSLEEHDTTIYQIMVSFSTFSREGINKGLTDKYHSCFPSGKAELLQCRQASKCVYCGFLILCWYWVAGLFQQTVPVHERLTDHFNIHHPRSLSSWGNCPAQMSSGLMCATLAEHALVHHARSSMPALLSFNCTIPSANPLSRSAPMSPTDFINECTLPVRASTR